MALTHCLRWLLLAALLVPAAGLYAPQARAQRVLSEAQVKASFIHNFARYVDWPERAFADRQAPILLCQLGRDQLGAAFTALENRPLHNRPVQTRLVGSADEARHCHVVYISDVDDRRQSATLRALAGAPILTIGDSDGFIDAGGIFGLVQGEQRYQFEVNLRALEQAQLRASAQLLNLARNVLR